MKIIEVLKNKTDNSQFDDFIGHYQVVKEGLNDIILIKNYEYKEIKEIEVSVLGVKTKKYTIENIVNETKYVVQPLDTLESIAKKLNKDREEILNKNNLKTEKLFIGQVLIV